MWPKELSHHTVSIYTIYVNFNDKYDTQKSSVDRILFYKKIKIITHIYKVNLKLAVAFCLALLVAVI